MIENLKMFLRRPEVGDHERVAECRMGAQRALQFSSSLKELTGFETATACSSTQVCSASVFRVLKGSIPKTLLQLNIKLAEFRAIDSR